MGVTVKDLAEGGGCVNPLQVKSICLEDKKGKGDTHSDQWTLLTQCHFFSAPCVWDWRFHGELIRSTEPLMDSAFLQLHLPQERNRRGLETQSGAHSGARRLQVMMVERP